MIRDIFSEHDNFLKEHYGFDTGQVIKCVQDIEKQVESNIQLMDKYICFCNELDKLYEDFLGRENLDRYSSEEDFAKEFFSLPEAQDLLEKRDEINYRIR